MKFPSLARTLSAAAAVGLLSSTVASAGVIRVVPVHPVMPQAVHFSLVPELLNAKCTPPSWAFACVTVTATTPGKIKVCISDSSPPSCKNLAPGTWTWSSEIVKVKNGAPTTKKQKEMAETIKPNPGNPTTFTIKLVSPLKASKKYKNADAIEACNSSSKCATGYIAIRTKG